MPPDRFTPPDGIPSYLVDGLRRQDQDTLRAIAAYAERLAAREGTGPERDHDRDHDDRDQDVRGLDDREKPPEGWDEEEWSSVLADADAPAKATLTVKTINDNDYYYYQWRAGDSIESEYVAPVSPSG